MTLMYLCQEESICASVVQDVWIVALSSCSVKLEAQIKFGMKDWGRPVPKGVRGRETSQQVVP